MDVGEREKGLRQKHCERDKEKPFMSPKTLHHSPIPRYTVTLARHMASTIEGYGHPF